MKYITKSLDWKIVLEHIASIFQSSHMLCNFQSKDNIYPLLNNSLYSNSYSSLDLLLHTFYSQGDKVSQNNQKSNKSVSFVGLELDDKFNFNSHVEKLIKKAPKKKKNRKKSECDYRKNICGYITRKIIKDFLSPIYNK